MVVKMDETAMHLCPDLKTATLHVKGKQVSVPSPGKDEVAYLFGATNPFTGEGLYEIYDHKTSGEFCIHLEHVMELFSPDFIFLVGDNAPAHHSAFTTDFLKEHHDHIEFVPLPTYSPNLNQIERLWKLISDNVTRNHFYDRLRQECKTIMNFLENLSFQEFINLFGLAKKLTT
jgi:hypothetical protein